MSVNLFSPTDLSLVKISQFKVMLLGEINAYASY